ncbi:MAG: putative toxin-antitoxin system toxin component, PIN family [Candidatus Dormibacteria bacterium]
MHERLRVLPDTNVLAAAVTSNQGVSARLLIAARAGRYRLIVSPLLLEELETVLARPKFRRSLSGYDAHRFVAMVRDLAEAGDDPPTATEPITPDPDDDFLVVLAEAPEVDVLASGDRDLTGLGRAGLTVKTPGQFLAYLPGP